MSFSRLTQEAADIQREPLEAGSAGPVDVDNPQQWVGHINGPPNTPYAQETFFFVISFPEEYPRKPFKLTFTSPIFHPNISEEGEVQLAELEDKYWSPVFTVRSILISIQALLSEPDLDDDISNSSAIGVNIYEHSEGQVIDSDVKQTAEPSHYGRTIGDRKYGMVVSRPEYEQYMSLEDGPDKDKFFVEHADIIWDV